jgi:hypothetical protein
MSNETIKTLPLTFIYKEAVNALVKNYQNNKHGLLSESIGRPETKCGWYSREQFDEMVQEMEYQNASGVRMYFGSYSSQHPEYANQLTIIFVPTRFNADANTHEDIVLDDQEIFAVRESISPALTDQPITKNLDSIGLCPPACAGQSYYYPYEEQ